MGAWLPAILGCLLPIPVFLLARRLFGAGAGMLSAFWVAVIPGTFLWVSHLGMPDHHAAEVATSLLALTILCAAAEAEGGRRWITAALAGVMLAAYLDTRAAGLFVPAILTIAAAISPALAPATATALGTACLLVIPASGISPWSKYTWLSLIAGLAVTAPLAILETVGRKRNWSRAVLYGGAAVVALLAIGCVAFWEAERVQSLIDVIRSYRPGRPTADVTGQVRELQPLWVARPGGFASLLSEFGAAWVFAIPGLALSIGMVWRSRRPVVALFAVWSITMLAGVFLQLRMSAYAGVVVAILAGVSTSWIVQRIPVRVVWLRGLAAGILMAGAAAIASPIGFAQTHPGQGPDPDWQAALDWLRWNTPEPLGDALAWYRWWPHLDFGVRFAFGKLHRYRPEKHYMRGPGPRAKAKAQTKSEPRLLEASKRPEGDGRAARPANVLR